MRVRKSRRRGLSGFGCGIALLTTMLVVGAVLLVSTAASLLSPSSSMSAPVLTAQPGAIAWKHSQRLSILLLGLRGTARTNGAGAIVVASYSPQCRCITLVNLPSTLWVTIPGFGQGRLADAYHDGGPRLALLVVQSALHIPIPYYAVFNFTTFRQVVDGLGGIQVKVPADARLSGGPGLRHLESGLALTYVRAGHRAEQGPDGRLARVAQVFLSLRADLHRASALAKVPGTLAAVESLVPTNFPLSQAIDATRRIGAVPNSRIHLISLDPASGLVTSYGRYLLPDWPAIQVRMQHAIPLSPQQRSGSVTVLNGSGIQGKAAALAAWLRQAHLQVIDFASAPSSNVAHTQVIINTAAASRADATASAVAALLQAPLVTRRVARSRAQVVVLIGQDFQDPTQQ